MLKNCRNDFPTLQGDSPPAYLDNACVTLKPQSVIDSIQRYYTETPGCGGRSVHRYGTAVSKSVVDARNKLGSFLNAATPNEIVFTRNATHSINQIAHGMKWNKGDVVLTSDREHNSNLVPWLQLEQEQGIDHRVVPSLSDNAFDLEAFESACAQAGDRLKMVAMSHVGNLDGVEIPIAEVTKIAHDHGALVAIDGAQSTPHMNVDVQALDIDFLSFSIHKMCGPSGMGGLWGRYELLDGLRTIQSGGQTVSSSTYTEATWAKPPARFEGGLGNFSGMMATGAAIDYLAGLDMNAVHEHEIKLNRIMTDGVKDLPGLSIIGPEDPSKRGGICSILMNELPAHDVALLLDEAAGVMVRSGQHCVHSWFADRGHPQGSLRASAYLYNNEEDVRRFVDTLTEIVQTLG
ncbi:MAG TPA: cysteine desulfurase [Candidatus Poseidoniales archaeon]|nr:MAG TPA: cysteine desulfurase [Candidatus Poseidoniales archaeon]|tara:strand:+ start:1267 stop:2481 length:1215 start_codon:yes stop_codon:yes gene_type:complete